MSRLQYTLWRLIGIVPVMVLITTFAFFLMRAAPGGPFDKEKALPPEIEKNIRAKYHLDDPLIVQYGRYLFSVMRGDLGPSFKYPNRTVNEIIVESFPVSLKLGLLAMCFALFFGLSAGVISALKQNRWQDYTFMGFALFGVSVPNIVLGPLLVLIFGLWLGWLPVAGWESPVDAVLPTITLGAIYVAYISRISRAGILEVLGQDYVTVARAKGLPQRIVVFRHILRGGLLPVVSFLGPAFASILTGSIVVEKIFHIPGLGQHFVQAALNRDYTLAMGTVIFYALILILLNLVVDLLYTFLDPRVRYE